MKKLLLAGLALCLITPLAQAESALDKGDVLLRAGPALIDPESDGLQVTGLGTISADSAVGLAFNVEYMFARNFGVELLASLPFTHDLQLNGTKIGETKHLPPTLSINYHLPLGAFVPYVGVGVNWTIFYDEKLDSSLDSVLLLDDSIGLAGQIGLDWILGNNLVINANVRYVSIETDAVIGGDLPLALTSGASSVAALGTVKINPWIYGLNIGYKF